YSEAEKAFKRYATLIPSDPNPYDSNAELLMKMGQFNEPITQYKKALPIDPTSISAKVEWPMDALYPGKPAAATATLTEVFATARNDGERRQAVFVQAVVYTDQGRLDDAIDQATKEFGIAERLGDAASMTADLNFKANMLLAQDKNDEALATFNRG